LTWKCYDFRASQNDRAHWLAVQGTTRHSVVPLVQTQQSAHTVLVRECPAPPPPPAYGPLPWIRAGWSRLRSHIASNGGARRRRGVNCYHTVGGGGCNRRLLRTVASVLRALLREGSAAAAATTSPAPLQALRLPSDRPAGSAAVCGGWKISRHGPENLLGDRAGSQWTPADWNEIRSDGGWAFPKWFS